MQLVLAHRRIATAAGHITSRQLSPRYMTGATRSHNRTKDVVSRRVLRAQMRLAAGLRRDPLEELQRSPSGLCDKLFKCKQAVKKHFKKCSAEHGVTPVVL